MRSDNTDCESGLPGSLFPAYPRADAMPVGRHAELFVNGVKSNDLEPLRYCAPLELESRIVHFL